LLDILELPVLADACVRGGHSQEAPNFTAHAARLVTRFPHVQVMQDVYAQANSAIRALLGQLLATLRAPAKLPSLFHAVGFLRRIRVFPERELALAFLTCRPALPHFPEAPCIDGTALATHALSHFIRSAQIQLSHAPSAAV
jgi:hypothetical protein